jgi:two-component system sensor histidine kinase DesK
MTAAETLTNASRSPVRWTRLLLAIVHTPIVLAPGISASVGLFARPYGYPWVPVVLTVPLGFIQIRHSLAAARGQNPRGRWLTLSLLTLLVYVPMFWMQFQSWALAQSLLVGSLLMILRGRTAVPAVGAVAAVQISLDTVAVLSYSPRPDPFTVGFPVLADTLYVILLGTALFAAARLVLVVDTLRDARVELAELAVANERSRVSRDLHDLLGQSLSAISLKGDLALRLLAADVNGARREIEGIADTARVALRGVRSITLDQHTVSLNVEVRGAVQLLKAAGIATTATVGLPPLPPNLEAALAWAVREGVTNVLRHSEARFCTLDAAEVGGTLRLAITNDGVSRIEHGRRGLTGLHERVSVFAGTVTAGHISGGRYQMVVEIPEGTTRL